MKLKRTILFLLCTPLLFTGCQGLFSSDGNFHEVVMDSESFTYKTSVSEDVLKTGGDPTYLVLINKVNPAKSGDAPKNLSEVLSRTSRSMQMEAKAESALYLMLREMQEDGITDLFVTSGYRDYDYQKNLYEKYLKEEQAGISQDAVEVLGSAYIQKNYTDKGVTKLSEKDAETVVQTYAAKPGYSEHQSGLCADLMTDSMKRLDKSFENTAAFTWLSQNAFRFGFILRYPEGKEEITGYSYEPWHYRFVGREVATKIYRNGLTLEEYLESH